VSKMGQVSWKHQVQCCLVSNPRLHPRWLEDLSQAGWDITGAMQSGSVSVLGLDHPLTSIAAVNQFLERCGQLWTAAAERGFADILFIGNLEVLIGKTATWLDWVALKGRLDPWFQVQPAAALWLAAETAFNPELGKAIVYSHDGLIYEGRICPNPWRMPASRLEEGLEAAHELDWLRAGIERHALERDQRQAKIEQLEQMNQLLQLEIQTRSRLQEELQKKLDRFEAGGRFLTLCSRCKRLRNDRGHWQSMDTFFSTQMGLQTSHGLCPECAPGLFPDVPVRS
jgi:hypothetical protein